MNIGERIKAERERLGFKQDDFAEKGGVSRRSQVMYEQNKTDASAGYFTKIAELGADVNYILTGVHALGFKAQSTIEFQPSATFEVGVANESFSDEDLRILRMIKHLPPTQKKREVENLEIFYQSANEYHQAMLQQGDLRMAA
jgi:transcriptional regulator with XRE-family HTH domain